MSDKLPIYEPGLEEVVKACRGRNLYFSTDVHKHVGEADIIFVRWDTSPAPTVVVHICRLSGHWLQKGQPASSRGPLAAGSGPGCLLSCCS